MRYFLIVLFIVVTLFVSTIIFSSSITEKTYIKNIQMTNQGIAIVTFKDGVGEDAIESLVSITPNQMGSRIYVGNVKMKKNIFNTYYYNNINIGLIKRKLKQQLIWMISCCFNKLLLFNLIFISISLILGIKSWHSVHLVQRYGIKISSVF